ncbi:type 1 glutamine amidotransferase [Streptosporangium sp. KLBMP 9127]|nr:type 1 glutamine amidotransferase [Streptosporangium sp. KLBMP 9127]
MRITVIEHEAEAGLGFLGGWLGGCEVVRPYRGEAVPERADALIVLGGEASAWDDEGYPWLPATRELLRRSAGDGVPTLGVCLGGQLLTLACGGAVERGDHGLEVGLRPVRPLPAAAGDRLLGEVGATVAVQYHQDVMARLPAGAVPLMTGEPYENQAYRLGEAAWAVQFHPEATPEIFAGWTAGSTGALAAAGFSARELDAQVAAAEERLVQSWRPVAAAFAALVTGKASIP